MSLCVDSLGGAKLPCVFPDQQEAGIKGPLMGMCATSLGEAETPVFSLVGRFLLLQEVGAATSSFSGTILLVKASADSLGGATALVFSLIFCGMIATSTSSSSDADWAPLVQAPHKQEPELVLFPQVVIPSAPRSL